MTKLENIPTDSGVYIFKDKNNNILYIGKAKNLRKRISSYLQKNNLDPKTLLLVKKINSINWIVTKNEVEALILENNLIKKYKPPFNIRLADDKTYPYLKLTIYEDFPRLVITRRKDDKNAIYFGPYTSALSLKATVNFIQKNFRLRKCNNKKFNNRLRPCLNYQINFCYAPCCEKISKEEYKKVFEDVLLFLKGKHTKLINELTKKMNEYSENLEFEKAANIRDTIENLKKFIENQSQYVEFTHSSNIDVFYYKKEYECIYFYVFHLKKGKIIDSAYYKFNKFSFIEESPLEEFIPRFYDFKNKIPSLILVQENIDYDTIKSYIEKKYNKKINIKTPKKGRYLELLKLAKKNLELKIYYEMDKSNILEKMKKILKLRNLPVRIDAFDISTFQGKNPVGARVVFINGEKEKTLYRRYSIKTLEKNIINDYAMMNEVLSRSIKEYIEKNEFPDLILIDGGKGQLNIIYKILEKNFLNSKIDLLSIAKDEKLDKIYIPNRKNPINLEKDKEIILFFMKIRDEVHRFAVSYHTQKDEKEKFSSILMQIKGIGEKRAKLLLKHFKSIEDLKSKSVEQLEILPFLNKKIAKNIYNFFNKD